MGVFGGVLWVGGRIFFLEQYAKLIVKTNCHTKFELDSVKRLEVIPLCKKQTKNRGFWGGFRGLGGGWILILEQ